MHILNQKQENEIQDKIIAHIRTALEDGREMAKDLRMKGYCPYMEWFNIALTRSQKPEFSHVMSACSWSRLMGEEAFIRKGETSAKIIVPTLSEGRIAFHQCAVFDVGQLQKSARIETPVPLPAQMIHAYGGEEALARSLGIKNDADGWNGFLRGVLSCMANIQYEDRIAYLTDCMAFQLGLVETITAQAGSFLENAKSMTFCYRILMNADDAIIELTKKAIVENEKRRKKEKAAKILEERRGMGIMERINFSKSRLGMPTDENAAATASDSAAIVKEHEPKRYRGPLADEAFREDDNPPREEDDMTMKEAFG